MDEAGKIKVSRKRLILRMIAAEFAREVAHWLDGRARAA